MENIKKYKDIRLITTDKRRKYLVSDPNYHRTNCFLVNLLAIEMNKTRVKTDKLICLGL